MPRMHDFDRRSAPSLGENPIVSIRKRGAFGLNKAAYEALDRPVAVKIVYSLEERVFGFKPTSTASLKAYPVKHYAKANSYEVAGTKFCGFYGIPVDEPSRRYAAVLEGDALLVRLEQNDTGNEDPEGG